MLVISDFYERGFIDKSSNASFIVLILKKNGVDQVSEFRPINLIGSTYKILEKCLALHLKEVPSIVISKEQGAFLEGKSTYDGVLCTNECIDA